MKRTINGLPPVHPGEYIREVLEDLGMTQAALAKTLGFLRCAFRIWCERSGL